MRFLRFFLFLPFFLFVQIVVGQDWVSHKSQRQINDLVDTGDELLMATDAGLVVLNKITLEKTIFNSANTNLPNNHIETITLGPNGFAWIGTYDVILSRFNGTDFDNINQPGLEGINEYTKLYDFKIAPNGDFWLGTSDGVIQKEGQYWTLYDEDELGPSFFEAWDIEIDETGKVFMASTLVYEFVDGSWTSISNEDFIGYVGADLFFSKTGELYLAGDLNQVGRYDGNEWQTFSIGDLNGSEVIGVTESLTGEIYFYTRQDGVFQIVNDVWTPVVNDQVEAFDNEISYFYIDEENREWLNSGVYLSVKDAESVRTTTISSSTLENNRIRNLRKGTDGSLYFITGSRKNISVLSPAGEWSLFPLPSESLTPFEFIYDLLVLEEDDIWLATYSGLRHFDGNSWTHHVMETCRSFVVDTQGKIYVRGTENRVYFIENGVIGEYNLENSPMSALILSGHGVDNDNNLWLSFFSWEGDNAIQRVTPEGEWTTYTEAEYPVITNRPVGDIHLDADGNIWFPNDLRGAIKFDGTTFSNPILDYFGPTATVAVNSIKSDENGKLYFAHDRGVITLLDEEWEELNNDHIDLPEQLSSSHAPRIEFDEDGNLWWASSIYGLFSYSSATTTSLSPLVPNAASLLIYPNPIEDITTLEFELFEDAEIFVSIYNQLGQQQQSINFGQHSPGRFQQTLDLAELPTGVYVLQLWIDGVAVSGKRLLLQ